MKTRDGLRYYDPYTILQTHVNGTVTIELRPGISERLKELISGTLEHWTENQMDHLGTKLVIT